MMDVVRKLRLDQVMLDRGLARSVQVAQGLVLAGKVHVDGATVDKPGTQITPDARVEVDRPEHPYASRGALKLELALDRLEIDPGNLDCLDVGASTGGFTDLLLQRGAKRVIALDVGRGQLAWRLRSDSRVVVIEGVNARYLADHQLPFTVTLATVDVSFISLRLVVPGILHHLEQDGWLLCLVKPQFEAERSEVGAGGIVRDEATRRRVIDDTAAGLGNLGLDLVGLVPSPIAGQKGNLEEIAAFRRPLQGRGRSAV